MKACINAFLVTITALWFRGYGAFFCQIIDELLEMTVNIVLVTSRKEIRMIIRHPYRSCSETWLVYIGDYYASCKLYYETHTFLRKLTSSKLSPPGFTTGRRLSHTSTELDEY